MTNSIIILNQVSLQLPNSSVQFHELSMQFNRAKYGIVGDNGIGKTTFLKLIAGELQADQGNIQTGKHFLLDQNPLFPNQMTILEALGYQEIIETLKRIQSGKYTDKDLELAADHWDSETQIEIALKAQTLWPIDLNRPMHTLSGGQKTKILLAKMALSKADFLLLDEPTNNLDQISRETLYTYITQSKQGMLIVSHDRTLLNKMDKILEITSKAVTLYGGNYDFYHQEKTLQTQAAKHTLTATLERLAKAKKTVQTRLERHQQSVSKGKKAKASDIKAKGQHDKLSVHTETDRSEKTNRRIRLQAHRKLSDLNQQLTRAKDKLEIEETLNPKSIHTEVPNNKVILNINHLYFRYNENTPWLFYNFSLSIIGPKRIAVQGANGSGKSSLLNLIQNKLTPTKGMINVTPDCIAYFDQNVSFLDPSLSIVDNFLQLNPGVSTYDAYSALALFQFKNKSAEKYVGDLSGGERMRAGLAICLNAKTPPQLLLLDEPTNHLDLNAIKAIEQLLNQYQGAILAVSHDAVFLEKIGITNVISI